MMEDQYWGMHLIWWVLWGLFLFWIFALPYNIPGQRLKKTSPLDILKQRLATGEINKEDYLAMKILID